MAEFAFWQDIVSPHMAGLAAALAAQGAKVTYVAARTISAEREQQGWSSANLPGVRFELLAPDTAEISAQVDRLSASAIHLTQGVRRNGPMADVHRVLRRRPAARWGAMMETIDERGLQGLLRSLDYRFAFGQASRRPHFVLAIGSRTANWVRARGFPSERVFRFAYFFDANGVPPAMAQREGPFRFCFAGQFIHRKRLDLLIQGLAGLHAGELELVVIGSGPLETKLRHMAETRLGQGNVHWLGKMPMMAARSQIAACDCLVLPSEHDGWGAVVIEALMSGTPVICSDACGAAIAVERSGHGDVFQSGRVTDLGTKLASMIARGPLANPARHLLAEWASCFSADAGAAYLSDIVACVYQGSARPTPPWERNQS